MPSEMPSLEVLREQEEDAKTKVVSAAVKYVGSLGRTYGRKVARENLKDAVSHLTGIRARIAVRKS